MIEARLREWLAEEEGRAAELRAIAARHDRGLDDEVELLRSASRAANTAARIRVVLGEPE